MFPNQFCKFSKYLFVKKSPTNSIPRQYFLVIYYLITYLKNVQWKEQWILVRIRNFNVNSYFISNYFVAEQKYSILGLKFLIYGAIKPTTGFWILTETKYVGIFGILPTTHSHSDVYRATLGTLQLITK